MIALWASSATADDYAAVTPFRDGLAVATAWHGHLEAWLVDGAAHKVAVLDAPATNPAIACRRDACLAAFVEPGSGGPHGGAVLFDRRGVVSGPLHLGPATRVQAVARRKDWVVAVEEPAPTRGLRVARVFRVGADGEVAVATPIGDAAELIPSTLRLDPDGAGASWADGEGRRVTQRFPDAPVVDEAWVPPATRTAIRVSADDPVVRVVQVAEDGSVASEVAALETLTRARAGWVEHAALKAMLSSDADGLGPPLVVPRPRQAVWAGTVEVELTGAASGRAVANTPADVGSRAAKDGALRRGEEAPLEEGEAWIASWRPDVGSPDRVEVSARLRPGAFAWDRPLPCGLPTVLHVMVPGSIDFGSIVLDFEDGVAVIDARGEVVGGPEQGELVVAGDWAGRCAPEGDATGRLWVRWNARPAPAWEESHEQAPPRSLSW